MSKKKTYKVTLEFDNEDAAHSFFVNWLDCGGDGGGNLDWRTENWDNDRHTYMRISGTGCAIEDGVVQTPEVEVENYKRREAEIRKRMKENDVERRRRVPRKNRRNSRSR